MKKFLLPLSIIAAFICLNPSAARADVFDFSFTGAANSGAGTITATEQGTTGIYNITNISGTLNGIAISALIPITTPYPDAKGANDNLLYYPAVDTYYNIAPGNVDVHGVAFNLTNGIDYNLWFGVIGGCPSDSGNTNTYYLMSGSGSKSTDYNYDPGTFDLTAETTEPASLLLLGTGALGGLFLMRRRNAVKQV